MCGISIVVNGNRGQVEKMGQAIRRRGITTHLTEISENTFVQFSYLPITDQTAPAPPFECGIYKVWLNGFISNWQELAEQYDINLETKCDTELLVKLIHKIGIEPAIATLNGFFSIAVWNGQIHVFTDRYGIKQLYRAESGGTTFICSEVKGILAIVKPEIDQSAADDWHYSLGVLTRNTIFKGIDRVRPIKWVRPEPNLDITYDDACWTLDLLWRQSVRRNQAAIKDGVFLSGGIDSGLIAKDFKAKYSFSMDYKNENLSEIGNIKINSRGIHFTMIDNYNLFDHFGEMTVAALDDLKVGPCYTNYALTNLASKYCTVLYSGAGSDELFFGYRHRYKKPIHQVIKRTSFGEMKKHQITNEEYDWAYLRGILIVEDRMTGAHAMEGRYPFLDNDFVDFVLTLPKEFREGKRILKDISGLPETILNSPKKGFANPITNDQWVKYAYETLLRLHGI